MTAQCHTNSGLCVLCRVKRKDFTPEERDARTVFCMQLAARIRPRDLEEFFSSVGKVKHLHLDIKISTDIHFDKQRLL